MPINLRTGLPGHGKTSSTILEVLKRAEAEKRAVYYFGIKDCMVPGWIELASAGDWPTVPDGSIVLIDEAQTLYRPRQHGAAVPPYVSALETHRHRGLDLYFITQHPMLIDNNVRRLVDEHRHVVRQFGSNYVREFAWPKVNEHPDKSKANATVRETQLPKAAFGLYKSAELHTIKRRIPWWVYAALVAPVLVGLAWWNAVANFKLGARATDAPAAAASAPGGFGIGARAPSRAASGVVSTADYLAAHVPRVEGLAYTAPVYDSVTAVAVAPYPAACLVMEGDCRCYTQQATRLDVPGALCASIVERGFFVAWAVNDTAARAQTQIEGDPKAR